MAGKETAEEQEDECFQKYFAKGEKKMDLKDRIQKVIDQRRATLLKERDKYEEKMRDTMSFYGVGGAYRRQEAARDKREEQLNELNDFEKQLKSTTKHFETNVYFFGCNKCGTVCMTTKLPFDEWHECPTCRQMIYLHNVRRKAIRIADDGQAWPTEIKSTPHSA